MKNPYEYDRTAPPLRSQATQRLMCRAWNECSASRDAEISEHHVVIKNLRAALVAEHTKLAEQAEIVSELVGAVESLQEGFRVHPITLPVGTMEKVRQTLEKAKASQ